MVFLTFHMFHRKPVCRATSLPPEPNIDWNTLGPSCQSRYLCQRREEPRGGAFGLSQLVYSKLLPGSQQSSASSQRHPNEFPRAHSSGKVSPRHSGLRNLQRDCIPQNIDTLRAVYHAPYATSNGFQVPWAGLCRGCCSWRDPSAQRLHDHLRQIFWNLRELRER